MPVVVRSMLNWYVISTDKMYMFNCRVIDTPGLADPDVPPEEIASMLASVVLLCPGGVHAFLYTHNATDYRFTAELKSVKKQVMVRYQNISFKASVHLIK